MSEDFQRAFASYKMRQDIEGRQRGFRRLPLIVKIAVYAVISAAAAFGGFMFVVGLGLMAG